MPGIKIIKICAKDSNDFDAWHRSLYIPIHDRQGSVATLLDGQGKVVESYRYDAFGNETITSRTTSNPWRFSSKRVDEETGFVYFGRRYYDPSLGKWLTQDPLGLKAGPNLYAYVVNNPLTYFDLYGLLEEEQAHDTASTRSFGERIWDEVKSFGRGCKNLALNIAEKIVHNMPHLGNMNDRTVDKLREWRGAPPLDRRPSGVQLVKQGNETATGCRAVGVFNGVCCGWEGLMENIEGLMEAFGDNCPDVYAFYSQSQGFCMDMFRAAVNIAGISTSNIAPLAAGIEQLTQICTNTSSRSYWVANPHSLGGITFWHACQSIPPERRNLSRISVESIASTKVFERKQGFCSAENYGGLSDFVTPISDPIGLAWKGILNGQFNFVGHPFQPPCFSHGYLSREYKNVLKTIVENHTQLKGN